MQRAKAEQGFTIVELIAVIVVVGILSIGTVSFISSSTGAYVSTASRQQLSQIARTAVERMTRELREALPNSIRLGSNCIEFIPIVETSFYEASSLPVTVASNSFDALAFGTGINPAGFRAVVFPVVTVAATSSSGNPLYDITLPQNFISSQTIASSGSGSSGADSITVNFSGPVQFPEASPQNRFHIVDEPVSFCQVGTRLLRFANYDFNATAVLPPNATGQVLLDNLDGTAGEEISFNFVPISLVRNAIVTIDLNMLDGNTGETVSVSQEVQVRNVP